MIEVHVANGLPALNIVGLPETAVKESKDRVSRRDFKFSLRISGPTHYR
jgi:predicted ATPase with chaperone activity